MRARQLAWAGSGSPPTVQGHGKAGTKLGYGAPDLDPHTSGVVRNRRQLRQNANPGLVDAKGVGPAGASGGDGSSSREVTQVWLKRRMRGHDGMSVGSKTASEATEPSWQQRAGSKK